MYDDASRLRVWIKFSAELGTARAALKVRKPRGTMTNSLEPSAVGEIVDIAGLGAAIVRPIQADDADALITFHRRLSDIFIPSPLVARFDSKSTGLPR